MSRRPDDRRHDRLSAYLDGELSPTEAAALERELPVDPALQADLDAMQRLSGRLAVEDEDYRAAQGIRAAVRGRLAEPHRRRGVPLARWWWIPAAATLAVVSFVALRAAGPLGPRPQQVQVEAVAEQYALALSDLGGGQP